jgi:hypothetical protein
MTVWIIPSLSHGKALLGSCMRICCAVGTQLDDALGFAFLLL